MILSDIKRYLSQRQQATLADIALHFGVEPDAMRGMLEIWVRKGKADKQRVSNSCGSSCNRCDPASVEIYRWREGVGKAQKETGPTGS